MALGISIRKCLRETDIWQSVEAFGTCCAEGLTQAQNLRKRKYSREDGSGPACGRACGPLFPSLNCRHNRGGAMTDISKGLWRSSFLCSRCGGGAAETMLAKRIGQIFQFIQLTSSRARWRQTGWCCKSHQQMNALFCQSVSRGGGSDRPLLSSAERYQQSLSYVFPLELTMRLWW